MFLCFFCRYTLGKVWQLFFYQLQHIRFGESLGAPDNFS